MSTLSIHDDLPALDNDDYRRGKLTNHKVFGEAIAVLAGDALLTLAFQLLAENKASRLEDNLRVIHEAALGAGTMGLIGGQVVDLFSAGEEVDEVTPRNISTATRPAPFTGFLSEQGPFWPEPGRNNWRPSVAMQNTWDWPFKLWTISSIS